MCGRFTQHAPLNMLAEQFLFTFQEGLPSRPRYNIAPTQPILAVRQPAHAASRQGIQLHWGLIPSWARDPDMGHRMINARSETVHEKPSFRSAFRQRRCLVLADGYYEWEKKAGDRQAWYFHRQDKQPFAVAGLWESWQGVGQDQPLLSGTILTTVPNELSRPIHDRMPVILAEEDYQSWLDPDNQDQDSLRALLAPCPDKLFARIPVSSHVNNPRHDDERCIIEAPTEQELF